MKYYDLLNDWVSRSWIRFGLILSTPRSASTALEFAFVNHEEVDLGILDPWDRYSFTPTSHKNADTPYEYILQQIVRAANSESLDTLGIAFANGLQPPMTIIIKEMTHQLSGPEHGDDYGRRNFLGFLRLIQWPVIVNVRNPLLQIESRLLRVCHHLTREFDPSLVEYLEQLGFSDWARNPGIQRQCQLLDKWSKKNCSCDGWLRLIDHCQQVQDYASISPILHVAFDLSRNGWDQVSSQLRWLDESGINYLVSDATLFRLDPHSILSQLFSAFGLESHVVRDRFDAPLLSKQIAWGMPEFQGWYGRSQNSSGVQPPIEISPTVGAFPAFMKDYVESSVETYSAIFKNRNLLRPVHQGIVEKTLGVKRSAKSYARLTTSSLLDTSELSQQEFLSNTTKCYRVLRSRNLLDDSEDSLIAADQVPEWYLATVSKLEEADPGFGCIKLPFRLIDPQYSNLFQACFSTRITN
jgi:hypothetical protein